MVEGTILIKKPKNYKKIGMIIFLTGILEIVGGAYFYSSTATFLETAEIATAKVVRMVTKRSRRDGKTRTSYAPVIKFKDSRNRSYTVESNFYSNPPRYRAGDSLDVLYDPQSPQDFKANNFFGIWGIAVAFAFASITSLIAGVVVYVVGCRQKVVQ